MKFDIMSIILMMIAIWLGSLVGSGIASMIGFAGSIIGSLVVGSVVYIIWSLLRGDKIGLVSGSMFAVLVWIAQMASGMVSGYLGLAGGIITLGLTSVVMAFLWGNFGTSGKGKVKSPIKLSV